MWKKCTRIFCLAAALAVLAIPAGAYYNIGSTGNDVKLIQKKLSQLGYKVKVDGYYGKDTAKAVPKFQKAQKIQASGKVGGWTYYLLTGKRTLLEQEGKGTKYPIKKVGNTKSISKYPQFKKYGRHDAVGDRLVNSAYKYLGVPYVFGGNTPDGFDCSGFTKYVFSHNGITLPRMADEQYMLGSKVSRSELIPGDLVFFTTYEPGVSHTGIYVGDNNFISATSSGGIRVDSLDSGYWSSRYVGAKRVR